MIFEKTPEDLSAWKNDMKVYEKNKRTKKPFGHQVPRAEFVTYEDVKMKEVKFNPILQNYRTPQDEALRTQNDEFQRAKSLMNSLVH